MKEKPVKVLEELTTLVDEAFRHHRNFRENQDDKNYSHWATKFKLKVEQTLKRWCTRLGRFLN